MAERRWMVMRSPPSLSPFTCGSSELLRNSVRYYVAGHRSLSRHLHMLVTSRKHAAPLSEATDLRRPRRERTRQHAATTRITRSRARARSRNAPSPARAGFTQWRQIREILVRDVSTAVRGSLAFPAAPNRCQAMAQTGGIAHTQSSETTAITLQCARTGKHLSCRRPDGGRSAPPCH